MRTFAAFAGWIALIAWAVGIAACEAHPQHEWPITNKRHVGALRGAGLTEAVQTGNPMFECSDSDSLMNSILFKAKNAQGEAVEGVLCCGWVKGCTVRF